MFDKDRDSERVTPAGTLDPDAPPTEEELRGAAGLRDGLAALDAPGPGPGPAAGPGRTPLGADARWLVAHLRVPRADDSLGELRARGLSRAAREAVQTRRVQAPRRASGSARGTLRQLGRALGGTGGLFGAAALLLVVSWVLLDHSARMRERQPGAVAAEGGRSAAATALLLGTSLRNKESPSRRLELMLMDRLQARRAALLRRGAGGGAGSLATAMAGALP